MIKLFIIILAFLSIPISCRYKQVDTNREMAFQQLLRKFRPIDIPSSYKINDLDNFSTVPLDKKSSDSIFFKDNKTYPIEAFGYIKDTSQLYKLIYCFIGDAPYFYIKIFDKNLNQKSDTVISTENTCVPHEPGSNYCSTTIEFKENSIICIDSLDNNGIDSLGYIIDSIRIVEVYTRELRIEKDGKIRVLVDKSK